MTTPRTITVDTRGDFRVGGYIIRNTGEENPWALILASTGEKLREYEFLSWAVSDARRYEGLTASLREIATPSYSELRAEAERYYRDEEYRNAMPWSEMPS